MDAMSSEMKSPCLALDLYVSKESLTPEKRSSYRFCKGASKGVPSCSGCIRISSHQSPLKDSKLTGFDAAVELHFEDSHIFKHAIKFDDCMKLLRIHHTAVW